MKRIAIITEFLHFKGGIEKSILALVNELKRVGIQVDIYAGLYDSEKTFAEFKNLGVRAFRKDKLPSVLNTIYLRYKFAKLDLRKFGYDGYVLYGSHSIAAAKKHKPNVLWSTRPLAYLYGWDGRGPDRNTDYLHGGNFAKKLAMKIYLKALRMLDQRQISNVERIKTVGVIAQRALRAAYPRHNVEVLYAPIDIDNYDYLGDGKYYLNVARHVPDKNVDRVIKAFQQMPDKKLWQVGEGDGKIEAMAKGYENIRILGFVSESELKKITGNCIATISASEGEDYSMNMMESVASGKPTISVNINKTTAMEPTETGVLMPNSSPENIIKAVKYLNLTMAKKMRSACIEKSKLFSLNNYAAGILNSLNTPKRN